MDAAHKAKEANTKRTQYDSMYEVKKLVKLHCLGMQIQVTKLQRETNDYHVNQGSSFFWGGGYDLEGVLLRIGNVPLLYMGGGSMYISLRIVKLCIRLWGFPACTVISHIFKV